MPDPPSLVKRLRHAAMPCLVMGSVCVALGAIAFVLSRNLFDPITFGRCAAESLSDPGVSAYAADLITDRIIRRKPDLIAFRPMVLSATETVVSNKAFRAVVEQAAARAHGMAFSEGSQRVLLSLPDFQVLVHEALRNASPALAARIPKSLDSTVARVANGNGAEFVLRLARTGRRLRWIWPVLFGIGLGLHVLAVCLATGRQQAMLRAGFGLVLAGLVLAGLVAVNPLAGLTWATSRVGASSSSDWE